MSPPLHLTPTNAPGCAVQSDGRHLPCSGVSGRTAVLFYPSGVDCRLHSKVISITYNYATIKAKFVCEARWNPDSPRQKRHGIPQNRNRQNGGKDNFQNLEGDDILSSKNGQLPSPPKTQTSQATSAPGQKEKEIIELFRKVQAQLRERAAFKEDKKSEGSKKQAKDSGTVESLLNVLRKHTVDESKSSHGRGKGQNFLEKPKENSQYHRGQRTKFVDSDSVKKDEREETKHNSVRPASKFQRRSPVSRVKYQPIPSIGDEYTSDSISPGIASGNFEKNLDQTPVKSDDDAGLVAYANFAADAELEIEEPELEFKDILRDESKENSHLQLEGLSKLKLQELRAMAKSRGLKGTSKMKKNDLVVLLSSSSV